MIDSLQLFWRMISTLCDEFIIFFKTLFYISKLNEKKRLLLMMGKTTAATRFEIYNKKSSLLFLRRLCNWIKRIIDEKIYIYV